MLSIEDLAPSVAKPEKPEYHVAPEVVGLIKAATSASLEGHHPTVYVVQQADPEMDVPTGGSVLAWNVPLFYSADAVCKFAEENDEPVVMFYMDTKLAVGRPTQRKGSKERRELLPIALHFGVEARMIIKEDNMDPVWTRLAIEAIERWDTLHKVLPPPIATEVDDTCSQRSDVTELLAIEEEEEEEEESVVMEGDGGVDITTADGEVADHNGHDSEDELPPAKRVKLNSTKGAPTREPTPTSSSSLPVGEGDTGSGGAPVSIATSLTPPSAGKVRGITARKLRLSTAKFDPLSFTRACLCAIPSSETGDPVVEAITDLFLTLTTVGKAGDPRASNALVRSVAIGPLVASTSHIIRRRGRCDGCMETGDLMRTTSIPSAMSRGTDKEFVSFDGECWLRFAYANELYTATFEAYKPNGSTIGLAMAISSAIAITDAVSRVDQ
jgi:hypothetical protein